jgi:hypothetical protein
MLWILDFPFWRRNSTRPLRSARASRNQADYDRIDVVSSAELAELLEDVSAFRIDVLDWLEKGHPDLS